MQRKIKYSRSALVLVILTSAIFMLVRCTGSDKKTAIAENTADFEAYATADKCASCHKAIYENHLKTAHYLTGQPANAETIMGSFENGKNTYSYTPSI
jgi:uncharacterized protein YgiB involved in biofilm formation